MIFELKKLFFFRIFTKSHGWRIRENKSRKNRIFLYVYAGGKQENLTLEPNTDKIGFIPGTNQPKGGGQA